MVKLIAFIAGSAAGAVAWWATASLGFMVAFLASTIATGVGMYYGAKYARQHLG